MIPSGNYGLVALRGHTSTSSVLSFPAAILQQPPPPSLLHSPHQRPASAAPQPPLRQACREPGKLDELLLPIPLPPWRLAAAACGDCYSSEVNSWQPRSQLPRERPGSSRSGAWSVSKTTGRTGAALTFPPPIPFFSGQPKPVVCILLFCSTPTEPGSLGISVTSC